MADHLNQAFETLRAQVGRQQPPSDWFTLTQDRVDQFADVTLDRQWIHVDPQRAADGPFRSTIAHGQLSLSIMAHLPAAANQAEKAVELEGHLLTINYGFDRVRFPAPVPVGTRIRSTRTLRRVEIKNEMLETMTEIVLEVEGQPKPAVVAESLARLLFEGAGPPLSGKHPVGPGQSSGP